MNLKNNVFLFILLLTFVAGFAGFFIYKAFQKSADEIIETNTAIIKSAVSQLVFETDRALPDVWEQQLKGRDAITKAEERLADSLLSVTVNNVLIEFDRVEGGLYFFELDEFIGYGFPTIEPPIPAFGPPPRSYNIIREQVMETIANDTFFTRLHEFDPAIFPLSTKPLIVDGEIIGAAWARKHIERELSATQTITSSTFIYSLGLALFGLAVAIFIAYSLQNQIRNIKGGLNKMKKDPNYRLSEQGGVLGFISRSINEMMDAQIEEHEKRKKLERELYQTEKMATLGNLVAGAAHEINTPISIIKTRIQIWERRLKKQAEQKSHEQILTKESMEIVHNEIDRVSQLIKRLLLLSKPVSKLKKAMNLNQMLLEKTSWLRQLYPNREIEIITDLYEDLPPAEVDAQSIDQVFMNILKNAVEASEDPCRIEIRSSFDKQQKMAQIEIRDFGSGISEAVANQIFDPFFTTKESGTGLGLSISYEIIKAHGGELIFKHPKTEILTEDKITASIHESADDFPSDVWNAPASQIPVTAETNGEETNRNGTVCVIRLPVY